MQIISRTQAASLGLKRYYTGQPCVHGHLDERMVSNWRCIKCLKAHRLVYLRERRRLRPGSYAEADRRHNAKHSAYKVAWKKEWRKKQRAMGRTPS